MVCDSREIRICHSGEAWKPVSWGRKLSADILNHKREAEAERANLTVNL